MLCLFSISYSENKTTTRDREESLSMSGVMTLLHLAKLNKIQPNERIQIAEYVYSRNNISRKKNNELVENCRNLLKFKFS